VEGRRVRALEARAADLGCALPQGQAARGLL